MRRSTQEKNIPKPGAEAAPTVRILRILDLLVLNGPMTLADLLEALPFSRASVWRALDTLRSEGWVRLRQNDGAYVLTEARRMRLSAAIGGAPEAEVFLTHWADWPAVRDTHFELSVVTPGGALETIETSAPGISVPVTRRDLQDDAMLVALMAMPRVDLVRHLNAVIEIATEADRRFIQSGALSARLQDMRLSGRVPTENGFLLPFAPPGLRACAVHIWSRSEKPVPEQHLADLSNALIRATDSRD